MECWQLVDIAGISHYSGSVEVDMVSLVGDWTAMIVVLGIRSSWSPGWRAEPHSVSVSQRCQGSTSVMLTVVPQALLDLGVPARKTCQP